MSESLRGGSHATPESRRPAPPPDVADLKAEEEKGKVEVNGSSTVAELRVVAQELDIPRYSRLRKPALLARVRKALGLS